MNKIFSVFFILLISFGLTAQNAEAKRMGGGGSIGRQSSSPQKQAQPPASTPAPATPAPSGGSKWLGPLAGLAAGGLLASLFMGQGAWGAFGSMLMILALVAGVFFIFRMLRRSPPQSAQYADSTEKTMVDQSAIGGTSAPTAAPSVSTRSTRPAWFEEAAFVREAKKHFIRLQDANDRGDLNDIREFVTPEMYAEISLQIQERAGKPNKTEVVSLSADIVDVITEGDWVIASVRFSGLIREEVSTPAESFSEIWHIQKSETQPNATWFISGIQQA